MSGDLSSADSLRLAAASDVGELSLALLGAEAAVATGQGSDML